MVRLALLRLAVQRTPLIKFRKGGKELGVGSGGAGGVTSVKSGGRSVGSAGVNVLEAHEVPLRYQRRPISEEECAVINAGGAVS